MADASVTKLYNILKNRIVGTRTSDVDTQIDTALQSIKKVSQQQSTNSYMDVFKDLVHKVGGPETDDFLKDMDQSTGIDTYQQGERISRYHEYEAIVSNISYCKRALKVLVDNILSPDDITKRSLQIIVDEELSDTNKVSENDSIAISRLHEIRRETKIEKHLEFLTSVTMKKGDFFIELTHSPKGENAFSVVTEGVDSTDDADSLVQFGVVDVSESKNDGDVPLNSSKIILYEYSPPGSLGGALGGRPPIVTGAASDGAFRSTSKKASTTSRSKSPQQVNTEEPEEKFKKKKKFTATHDETLGNNKLAELKDIFIAFHDPKYVIRLETERFRICLGYLVFPKVDMSGMQIGTYSAQSSDVDTICANIVKQLQDRMSSGRDVLSSNGDLRDVVSGYLKVIKDNEDLKVRYVPPHMMSHWRMNADKFDPYGESIFDSVKFDCKLLMALKTAVTIKRLTSATDKRVISVETGLPRNAKNLVEMVREGLRKRKISVDNFGSVDTIPSHITTFEDIYIPMRDGKKFVEFENIQFGPDPQQDIEPLKFMRDNIVGNLHVPAPFLGIEENTSNRALLTVENIMFARTIISYQREFSELLKDLFQKIYTLVYTDVEMIDGIKITFPPPKASPYEHQMEYLEQAQRIIESLATLGVSKTWAKKKYLPDFPWDEIDKATASDRTREAINVEKSEDGGMGGGFGGGY